MLCTKCQSIFLAQESILGKIEGRKTTISLLDLLMEQRVLSAQYCKTDCKTGQKVLATKRHTN
jgi:hypothetical protein